MQLHLLLFTAYIHGFRKLMTVNLLPDFFFYYIFFLFIICSNQLSNVCMFDATAFNNELLLNVVFDGTHVMSVE